MSRCKACNRIMKKCDWSPVTEGGPEEAICMTCRQEIIKNTEEVEIITEVEMELDEFGEEIPVVHETKIIAYEIPHLGFDEKELSDMQSGIYVDYRGGSFDT